MQGLIIVFVTVVAIANAQHYAIPHDGCPINEDPFNPTHLPVPDDCTKFYKCQGGLAYLMDCPIGLHWSEYHDRCEWPGLAIPKCKTNNNQIETISVHKIANSAEGPIKHPNCPLDDDQQNPTLLSYPSDCGKFYKCLNGLAYPMFCPVGLHWNDNAKVCDWPTSANCIPKEHKTIKNERKINNDILPILTKPEYEAPIKNDNCPEIDDPVKPIHLPYPNNCTKFYKCSYGYAYAMDCPDGEHFGVEIDRCDWPNVAKCDPNIKPENTTTDAPTTHTTSTTTTTVPSSTTSEQPTSNTTTTTVIPTSTTESPNTTVEPVPPGIDCSNVPHGTLYAHPHDCTKFIHCDYGQGVVKICPANLHFSPSLLVCQWPGVANCIAKP